MADDARFRPSVRPGGFFREVPRRRQRHQTGASGSDERGRESSNYEEESLRGHAPQHYAVSYSTALARSEAAPRDGHA